MSQLKFVDLFAGCGGLSLGLAQAGLKGQFAIERDAMAFETFEANLIDGGPEDFKFGWPEWLEKQAWDIEDLLAKHRADLQGMRGQVDVLAGGPPCQGFSFAGRRVEDDPRNLLFNRYVEVVEALQPKAIILENVPGMKVAHRQSNVISLAGVRRENNRRSYYDRLVDRLESAGYKVEAELIDSSRFGVPQTRSRLIAIGLREDVASVVAGGPALAFQMLEEIRPRHLKQLGLPDRVVASDAISDLELNSRGHRPCTDPQSRAGFQEHEYEGPGTDYQRLMHEGHEGQMDSMRLARHRADVTSRFARIQTECRKGVPMSEQARKAFGIKKQRIHPMLESQPSPTITTLPDDVLHYSEPRILTVRESARIQSFPDWFQFKGKFTTGGHRRKKECPRYSQVGNAVPPLLARAIGTALSELLQEAGRQEVLHEAEGPALPAIANG